MNKNSILAFALLLFVVLGCLDSNSNSNSNSNTTPQNSGAPGSTSEGSGPVSNTSGPTREDYGPNRNPAENQHDYLVRQQGQGQVGPCSSAWQEFYVAYFEWKNGRLAQDRFVEIQRRYDECVAREYP